MSVSLAALLAELDRRGLRVKAAGGKVLVRGGGVDDDMRAALAEHKAALLRLYRESEVHWRRELLRRGPDDRAEWWGLVQLYDNAGCTARGAEWLAWDRLTRRS